METLNKILAIDIGGTFTKFGIVKKDGTLSGQGRVKTPSSYDELLEVINDLRVKHTPQSNSICISSPCNYHDGALRGSSFAEYLVDKDILGDLFSRYEIKALIENDGNCAALCEKWVGNGVALEHFSTIVVGSGIGGGVILKDSLLKGEVNLGGDLGYMLMGAEAKTNGVANCYGILGATKHNYEVANKVAPIQRLEDIFSSDVTDPAHIKIREDMARVIAVGCINFTYIFGTPHVLIGGEISKSEFFMACIESQLEGCMKQLSGYKYRPTISTTRFNNDSNLIGAASLYFSPLGTI